MADNSLVFQIGADLADLQRKLSEAKGHLKDFADTGAAPVEASLQQVSRAFEQLGSKLTSIGTSLSVAITAPLVGLGVASVNVAGEFGAAMNKVKANLDDVTVNGIKQLDLLAQQLGAKTKFSALEAAQGMGEFAAAGFKTQEIMAVMPATLDLAAAAQTNVAEASRVTKDLLGQFGLSANEAQHAIDVMAKAGTESSGSLLDMANSLTYVGPVAKSLGMNIVDTTAALIELDKAGLRNEKSGRALRDMLGDLVAPTAKAQEVMTSLGISVKDAAGNLLPFPQVMENFKVGLDKTQGSAERLSALTTIFGKESLAAAEILTSQGSPALLAYAEKLSNVEGAASKMAKTMNEGTKGALEQLRGSLETAGIALGQALEPSIVSIAKTLQNFIDNTVVPAINWFKQLPEPVQNAALGFTALAAAIGPLILIAGQFATAIGAIGAAINGLSAVSGILSGVGGAGASIAALTGALLAAKVAIIAVGVAFAGWAIYEWIKGINETSASLDNMYTAIGKVKGISAEYAKTLEVLESTVVNAARKIGKEGLTVQLTALKQQLVEGKVSLEQYKEKLAALVPETEKLKMAQVSVKDSTGALRINLAGAIADLGGYADTSKKAADAVAGVGKQHQDNAPKARDYGTAITNTAKAKKEAEQAALSYNTALTSLGLGNELSTSKAISLSSALALVTKEVGLGLRPTSDLEIATANYNAAIEKLYPSIYSLNAAFGAMQAAILAVKPSLDALQAQAPLLRDYLAGVAMSTNDSALAAVNAQAPTAALSEAYKTLGITSSQALADKAAKAREAYTAIATSGTASASDIQAAYQKMIEAQKAALPGYTQSHVDSFGSILSKGAATFAGPGSLSEKWNKFQEDAKKWTSELASHAISKLFQGGTSWKELGVTGIGQVGTKWDEMKSGMLGSVGTLAEGLTGKLFSGQGSWKEIGLSALAQLGTAFASWGASVISQATGIADKLAGIFSSIKVPSINIPGLGGGSTSGGATGPVDTSGISGAVSSGIAGIVSAAGAAVSAISGVVGNFQMSGMNKSLDVIVQHTLGTKNELENLRADEWTREGHNMAKWDDIWNAILGINSWDAPVVQKLQSIWETLLGGGIATGGGTGEAALQSIEQNISAINEQISGFRAEVSTGFFNMAVQGDSLVNELRTISDHTTPRAANGAMAVSAPMMEEGLRNINLSVMRIVPALDPLVNLGAIRNNVGVINGIKEALVGQLGMIYGTLKDDTWSALKEVARNTYPVYQVYDRIWRTINTATAAGQVRGGTTININVDNADSARVANELVGALRLIGQT